QKSTSTTLPWRSASETWPLPFATAGTEKPGAFWPTIPPALDGESASPPLLLPSAAQPQPATVSPSTTPDTHATTVDLIGNSPPPFRVLPRGACGRSCAWRIPRPAKVCDGAP